MKRLFLLPLLLMSVSATSCGKSESTTFTPQLWAEGKSTCFKEYAVRTEIWKDMERNHLRVGMRKDDVIALLGQPEYTLEATDTYVYCLGPRMIDFDEYAITFDAQGNVSDYRYRPG